MYELSKSNSCQKLISYNIKLFLWISIQLSFKEYSSIHSYNALLNEFFTILYQFEEFYQKKEIKKC